MSVESIAKVLNQSRSRGTDKLVLIGIANHDGDGGAWPSLETLARYANVDVRTVQRSLRRLELLGELTTYLQDGGTTRTPNDRRPNRYEITLQPRGDTHVTPSHERGDVHVTPGVTSTSPRGVTSTSPEPSLEPSINPPLPPMVDITTPAPRAERGMEDQKKSPGLDNARRALARINADAPFPEGITEGELLDELTRIGRGDTWAGYLAAKPAWERSWDGVRDPAAALRARLKGIHTVPAPPPAVTTHDDHGPMGDTLQGTAACRRAVLKARLARKL
jgi:hypothetical protein